MKYKELINKLPKGWSDVSLIQYQRIMKQEYFFDLKEGDEEYELQQIDNSLLTIAALMDIDISILRGYTIPEYMQLIKLTQWVGTLPEASKVKPEYIKDAIDITLDNYLTFQAIAGNQTKALENIKGVASLFIKDVPVKPSRWFFKSKAVAKVDIDQWNMIEVVTFFFFVHKLLNTSLKRIQTKLTKQLVLVRMQQRMGLEPRLL